MIGIIDVDMVAQSKKRFPNLASMKISSFWKQRGEETMLVSTPLEATTCRKIYASKVFTDTIEPDWMKLFDDRLERGGTGYYFADAKPLPEEIEHSKPDYDLYTPAISSLNLKGEAANIFQHAAIGYTTRGCFRQCPFCVNQHYKRVVRHSRVSEFDDETRTYIIMLDDNILGFSGWREVFDELKTTNKPFIYKQGMDMRIMTREKAQALSDAKYYTEMVFALDNIKDSELFAEKAALFREYCSHPAKGFVLTGFYERGEEAFVSAFKRMKTLAKYEILPYIMRFKDCYSSEFDSLFATLAAWANQPAFYKKNTFAEFCKKRGEKPASQYKRVKNKELLEMMNEIIWEQTV